jgi:mannose-6-phosphate isomerase-like protein (cupin superfamily)
MTDVVSFGKSLLLSESKNYQVKLITIGPKNLTDYVKNTNSNKYIMVLEGSGIVTVNTVDFTVEKYQTMFIKFEDEHLYANTNSENNLVILETATSDNFIENKVILSKKMS